MKMTQLHETLANCHPSLARGQVWCRKCGHTQKVKNGLANGWPKCCGFTMTIDSPEEQKALAAKSPENGKVIHE